MIDYTHADVVRMLTEARDAAATTPRPGETPDAARCHAIHHAHTVAAKQAARAREHEPQRRHDQRISQQRAATHHPPIGGVSTRGPRRLGHPR